jgi:hypothetical protein
MNKLQAMCFLKDLIDKDLVEASYISLYEMDNDECHIQIKCQNNKQAVINHANNSGLSIIGDSERKYIVIFRKSSKKSRLMAKRKIQDAIDELSRLKNVSYGDFLDALLCSSEQNFFEAYKKLFPEDTDLHPKEMYVKIQNLFLNKAHIEFF